MNELRRVFASAPAFDRRSADPAKNFGIGGVTLRWAVVGPLGAVSWSVLTRWYLPQVLEEIKARFEPRDVMPTAGAVSYHAVARRYDSQDLGPT